MQVTPRCSSCSLTSILTRSLATPDSRNRTLPYQMGVLSSVVLMLPEDGVRIQVSAACTCDVDDKGGSGLGRWLSG